MMYTVLEDCVRNGMAEMASVKASVIFSPFCCFIYKVD